MNDYDSLTGDNLNRAIAESLRWFEHSPGKWLQPVDRNITPQLVFVSLPDWAQTPGLALQHIVNDGFQFAITHDQPGTLRLQIEGSAAWEFDSEAAWNDLHLHLIREWLNWKNPDGPRVGSRKLYD